MIRWLYSRRMRKWWFILFLFLGPLTAFVFWQEGEHIKSVEAKGAQTTAEIKTIVGRRGRSLTLHYTIDLAWTDKDGRQRTAANVPISNTFAGSIAKDGNLTTTRVPIKYLFDQTDTKPVVLPDRANQAQFYWFLFWTGLLLGAIGLVGTIVTFGFGRSKAT